MMKALLLSVLVFFTAFSDYGQTEPKTPVQPPTLNPNVAKIMTSCVGRRFGAIWLSSDISIDRGRIKHFRLYLKDFILHLKEIDPTACPEKFRTAWMAYVAAWEAVAKSQPPSSEYLDLAELIPQRGVQPSDVIDMVAQGEPESTREAWGKVEQAALDLGFDIKKLVYR